MDRLNEIRERYPEEKPVVFNYQRAREDALWLIAQVEQVTAERDAAKALAKEIEKLFYAATDEITKLDAERDALARETAEVCSSCKAIWRLNGGIDGLMLERDRWRACAEAFTKAQAEGKILAYGPGDRVWDRFGMMWEVTSAELHLLDGKRTPLYRCGHPGTEDYCALWAHEALDEAAGVKSGEEWEAEVAAIRHKHEAVVP